MRYVLKNDGYSTFDKIMQGRKWVGRVVKHAEGGYFARIGTIEARGATKAEAFGAVAAQALGFENEADLHDHNRVVRQRNAVRKAEARHAVNEMLRGNFEPFRAALLKTGGGR